MHFYMFPLTINSGHSTRQRQTTRDRSGTEHQQHVGFKGAVHDIGRPGTARLDQAPGMWHWTWASPARDFTDTRLQEGSLLFPPFKRAKQELPSSLEDTLRYANDYLLHSLDKYDRFGVQDLIADELRSERLWRKAAGTEAERGTGRLLELIHNRRGILARYLAVFSSGELGESLNVSPFLPASSAQGEATGIIRFFPVLHPVMSFPLPIRQICASAVVSSHRLDRDATALLVRTETNVYLLNLVPHQTYMPPTEDSPAHVIVVGQLEPADTAGLRIVDAALDSHTWSRALLVDELGGIWTWFEEKVEMSERLEKKMILRHIEQTGTQRGEAFHKIAYGTRQGTALHLSRKTLELVDLEGGVDPRTLMTVGSSSMFTDLEKTASARGASCTIVSTSHEVMWVDELKENRPILCYTHDIGGGTCKDLRLAMIEDRDGDCLLLHSDSYPLVIAFRVSSESPIRCHSNPYPMAVAVRGALQPLRSLAALPIRRHTKDHRSTYHIIGMCHDGALWSLPTHTPDHVRRTRNVAHNEGRRIRRGNERTVGYVSEEEIPSALREIDTRYRELSCRWAWNEINDQSLSESPTHCDADDFRRYLRELETPFEHLLTACDLARDMVHLDSSLLQSSILRTSPTWSDEITKLLDMLALSTLRDRHICSSTAPSLCDHTQASLQPASDAVSDIARLAADLLFSRYTSPWEDAKRSSDRKVVTDSIDEHFARATEQLSLEDSAPSTVSFAYLEPKFDTVEDESHLIEESIRQDHRRLNDANARAVLDEWTLTTQPASYTWQTWRTSASRSAPLLDGGRAQSSMIDSSGRPIIPNGRSTSSHQVMRSTVADDHSYPPIVARSSPPPMLPLGTGHLDVSSSQPEAFAQTQIEPGRFGGRDLGGGKKKAKRRIGGF